MERSLTSELSEAFKPSSSSALLMTISGTGTSNSSAKSAECKPKSATTTVAAVVFRVSSSTDLPRVAIVSVDLITSDLAGSTVASDFLGFETLRGKRLARACDAANFFRRLLGVEPFGVEVLSFSRRFFSFSCCCLPMLTLWFWFNVVLHAKARFFRNLLFTVEARAASCFLLPFFRLVLFTDRPYLICLHRISNRPDVRPFLYPVSGKKKTFLN